MARLNPKREVTEKEIRQALEPPDSFAYFGEDRDVMFVTWSLGPMIEHRDSDLIVRANAEALRRHLKSDPSLASQWEEIQTSHWAVGWSRHVKFKALDKPLDKGGKPTRMFRVLMAWFDGLKKNHIADEVLYSEMEMKEFHEAILSIAAYIKTEEFRDDLPENWINQIEAHIGEAGTDPDMDATEENFMTAARELGFLKDGKPEIGAWQVLEDDTHYLEVRHIGGRRFQFIQTTDMADAAGADEDDPDVMVTELSLVDLTEIPEDTVRDASRFVDLESRSPIAEGMELDLAIAEACFQYGAKAPLSSMSSADRDDNLQKMRLTADKLSNSVALQKALEQPVNAMGSSALEYMRGDLIAAIKRGAEAGDLAARTMAKTMGIPQEVVDDARPEDFLPYIMGYGDAMGGREASREKNLAPEYLRGYARGQRVLRGEAPPPSWIKTV